MLPTPISTQSRSRIDAIWAEFGAWEGEFDRFGCDPLSYCGNVSRGQESVRWRVAKLRNLLWNTRETRRDLITVLSASRSTLRILCETDYIKPRLARALALGDHEAVPGVVGGPPGTGRGGTPAKDGARAIYPPPHKTVFSEPYLHSRNGTQIIEALNRAVEASIQAFYPLPLGYS